MGCKAHTAFAARRYLLHLVVQGPVSVSPWRCPATAGVSRRLSCTATSSPTPLPVATKITSASNAYIKHCVKLRESARYRQQQQRVLLVGSNLLKELTGTAAQLQAHVLFVRDGAPAPQHLLPAAAATVQVSESVMWKLTGLEEAEGVDLVAELQLPALLDLQQGLPGSKPLRRLLVLEGVQDPGNLGTLIRCAAAFAWDAVWLLPGCCDPFNDKALRASRGAALRVPLASGSWQQLQEVAQAQGLLLLAAEPEEAEAGEQQQQQQQTLGGQRLQQEEEGSSPSPSSSSSSREARGSSSSSSSRAGSSAPWLAQLQQQPVCLVLGAEGKGLSRTALSLCRPLAIPMLGDMESLNVGVAGGILMFLLSQGLPGMLGSLGSLVEDS